jgi:hypothetical protein
MPSSQLTERQHLIVSILGVIGEVITEGGRQLIQKSDYAVCMKVNMMYVAAVYVIRLNGCVSATFMSCQNSAQAAVQA